MSGDSGREEGNFKMDEQVIHKPCFADYKSERHVHMSQQGMCATYRCMLEQCLSLKRICGILMRTILVH